MVFLPFFIRTRVLDSINIAEKLKGSPPTCSEIYTVFLVHYRINQAMSWFFAILNNMYREDKIYADKAFTYYSLTKEGTGHDSTFENFSERFRRLFPDYMLDKNMRIRAKPETPVINLEKLTALLKSKDAKEWKSNAWIFDGKRRFLDGTPILSNKIAFESFPRSGNTFLRKYFELLTGVWTGADNTLHVNVHLQMQGLAGEDIVDDTTWVVKTHSPWCMPEAPLFKSNKVVVIVRNPLDVIISWINLLALCNH